VDIEALKRARPIARVVAHYGVALRPTGRDLVGRCPFHPDGGRPNLYVYPESDSWWCYRCNVGRDAIDFVARIEGLDLLAAAARLAGLPGAPVGGDRGAPAAPGSPARGAAGAPAAPSRPRRRPAPAGPGGAAGLGPAERDCLAAAVEVYHRRLLADGAALAYVEGRGVDRRTIRRYRVGFAAGELAEELRRRALPAAAARRAGLLTRSGREFLRGRVVFPELRDGRPIWLVGRPPDPPDPPAPPAPPPDPEREGDPDRGRPPRPARGAKYLGLPGRKPLLGWDAARASPEVCLVEGPFDALVLATWGIPAVALVGTHGSPEVLRDLEAFRRVYLALDADASGREGTAALRAALGARAVPVSLAGIRGVKDVADLAALPSGRALFDGRLGAARRVAGRAARTAGDGAPQALDGVATATRTGATPASDAGPRDRPRAPPPGRARRGPDVPPAPEDLRPPGGPTGTRDRHRQHRGETTMTQSDSPAAPAAPARPAAELVHGVVEGVNEKGVKIDGRWFNYSRFRDVPHPDVGDLVEVLVKNHFIEALKPVGPGPAPAADGEGAPPVAAPPPASPAGWAGRRLVALPAAAGRPAAGAAPRPRAPAAADSAAPGPVPTAPTGPAGPARPAAGDDRARRERVISRLAVLKAAADFLARRPDAVPDDVLAVAIQWLVWVEEDDGAPGA
jgi:DNA primase